MDSRVSISAFLWSDKVGEWQAFRRQLLETGVHTSPVQFRFGSVCSCKRPTGLKRMFLGPSNDVKGRGSQLEKTNDNFQHLRLIVYESSKSGCACVALAAPPTLRSICYAQTLTHVPSCSFHSLTMHRLYPYSYFPYARLSRSFHLSTALFLMNNFSWY